MESQSAFSVDSKLNTPWQLRLLSKGLKKQQKLKALTGMLGRPAPGTKLLLITNGDNNGAMNFYLRQLGGRWTWGEFEEKAIPEMSRFLREPVAHLRCEQFNFPDDFFDIVVVIDVHEHLPDTSAFNRELFRILKPSGQLLISVPNGDSMKIGIRIKNLLGMTKEVYGHVRDGYTIPQIQALLTEQGFTPVKAGTYSKFFTEMVELGINFGYVKVLNRNRNDGSGVHGPIAPSSGDQVRKVEKTLKLYSLIYPLCWLVASLDRLIVSGNAGYMVVAKFQKPSTT